MFKFLKSITKSIFRGAKEGIKEEVKENPQFQKVVEKHPKTYFFLRKRLSKKEKYGLYFSIGTLIFLLFVYLFAKILFGYINHNALVDLDVRALNIVKFFRNPSLNQEMLFITYLGKWEIVISGLLATTILWSYLNCRYYAYLLIISVSGGELFVWLTKNLVERARPSVLDALYQENGYSFPSGHTFVAMSFYGLLGYLIFINLKNRILKSLTVVFFLFFIIAIGFSRVYLGVHWLSDVLASFVGGIAWVTILSTVFKTKQRFGPRKTKEACIPESSDQKTTILLLFFLFIVWISYVIYFYNTHPLPKNSTLASNFSNEFLKNGEKIIIPENDFPDKIFELAPRVSENIVGKPMEPINVIIVGNKGQLFQIFKDAGWFQSDPLNLSNVWKLVAGTVLGRPYHNAPGVPSLWNALPNEIGFEKPTAKDSIKEREHVHFWNTPFFLSDGRPIWVGTAHFDQTVKLKASIYFSTHTIDPAIDKERERITNDLLGTKEVSLTREFQMVEPTLGQNQSGDAFFTDGKAEIFYLGN